MTAQIIDLVAYRLAKRRAECDASWDNPAIVYAPADADEHIAVGLLEFAAQGAPPAPPLSPAFLEATASYQAQQDRTASDHHIFTDEELVDLRTLFPEV